MLTRAEVSYGTWIQKKGPLPAGNDPDSTTESANYAWRFLRRTMPAITPKPANNMAYDSGSGTGVMGSGGMLGGTIGPETCAVTDAHNEPFIAAFVLLTNFHTIEIKS
jgi:hypothetical protein